MNGALYKTFEIVGFLLLTINALNVFVLSALLLVTGAILLKATDDVTIPDARLVDLVNNRYIVQYEYKSTSYTAALNTNAEFETLHQKIAVWIDPRYPDTPYDIAPSRQIGFHIISSSTLLFTFGALLFWLAIKVPISRVYTGAGGIIFMALYILTQSFAPSDEERSRLP
jgi:hypothetical protein